MTIPKQKRIPFKQWEQAITAKPHIVKKPTLPVDLQPDVSYSMYNFCEAATATNCIRNKKFWNMVLIFYQSATGTPFRHIAPNKTSNFVKKLIEFNPDLTKCAIFLIFILFIINQSISKKTVYKSNTV